MAEPGKIDPSKYQRYVVTGPRDAKFFTDDTRFEKGALDLSGIEDWKNTAKALKAFNDEDIWMMKLMVRYDALPNENFKGDVLDVSTEKIIFNYSGPIFKWLYHYAPQVTSVVIRTKIVEFMKDKKAELRVGKVEELSVVAIPSRHGDFAHRPWLILPKIRLILKALSGLQVVRFVGFAIVEKNMGVLGPYEKGLPRLDLGLHKPVDIVGRENIPPNVIAKLRAMENEWNAASGAQGRIPPMR